MEPNIKLTGTAFLQEVYENEAKKTYFAVLSMRFATPETEKHSSTEVRAEIPITSIQYRELREALSKSSADRHVLRVKGNLELSIEPVCIN